MEALTILNKPEFEVVDEPTQEIIKSFDAVRESARLKPEEATEMLQKRILAGEHDMISFGLVYGILLGHNWLDYLSTVARDKFKAAGRALKVLLPSLAVLDRAAQLLFNLQHSAPEMFSEVVQDFLRVAPDEILHMLCLRLDQTAFPPDLTRSVFFVALKQLSSHVQNNESTMDDVYIITHMWSKYNQDVLTVGRDAFRLLMSISKVTGLEQIWNELSNPTHSGVPLYWSILSMPTTINYLLVDTTVEQKLIFVLEQAQVTNFHRYMTWIGDQVGEANWAELVRYMVTHYHKPPGEGVSRWMIVCWFLNQVKDLQHNLAAIKQALIYDVLFFTPQDSIFYIEPFFLAFAYSISKYPHTSEELMEFLFLTMDNFDKKFSNNITVSVIDAFKAAEGNNLIPQIDILLKDERLSAETRTHLGNILQSVPVPMQVDPPPIMSPISDEPIEITVSQRLIDQYGEVVERFAENPTFELFCELLERIGEVTPDLIQFLVGTIGHELNDLKLLTDQPFLTQLFTRALETTTFTSLIRSLAQEDQTIGIRLLIHSLKEGNETYSVILGNTEADLEMGVLDVSFETLRWIFPRLLPNLKPITVKILHLVLQTADPELLTRLEFDLYEARLSLVKDNLNEQITESVNLSSTEQTYFWKLALAELKWEHLGELLTSSFALMKDGAQLWELMDGVFSFIRPFSEFMSAEQIMQLFSFPAKYYAQMIHLALTAAKATNIEDAILQSLEQEDFKGKINLFRHCAYWVEANGKLKPYISSRAVQDAFQATLSEMSSEYFKEFNCILEASRQIYTL